MNLYKFCIYFFFSDIKLKVRLVTFNGFIKLGCVLHSHKYNQQNYVLSFEKKAKWVDEKINKNKKQLQVNNGSVSWDMHHHSNSMK